MPSAPDPEIDAAGIERLQHAEGFGVFERAVMAQHHAAGTDPQMPGLGGNPGNQDLGRGAGEAGQAVMLGKPIAVVAEPIDMPGELECFMHSVGRRNPLADRRLVEDAELHAGRLAQPLLSCEDLACRGARDDP